MLGTPLWPPLAFISEVLPLQITLLCSQNTSQSPSLDTSVLVVDLHLPHPCSQRSGTQWPHPAPPNDISPGTRQSGGHDGNCREEVGMFSQQTAKLEIHDTVPRALNWKTKISHELCMLHHFSSYLKAWWIFLVCPQCSSMSQAICSLAVLSFTSLQLGHSSLHCNSSLTCRNNHGGHKAPLGSVLPWRCVPAVPPPSPRDTSDPCWSCRALTAQTRVMVLSARFSSAWVIT